MTLPQDAESDSGYRSIQRKEICFLLEYSLYAILYGFQTYSNNERKLRK